MLSRSKHYRRRDLFGGLAAICAVCSAPPLIGFVAILGGIAGGDFDTARQFAGTVALLSGLCASVLMVLALVFAILADQ